jgi:hypothetical protein
VKPLVAAVRAESRHDRRVPGKPGRLPEGRLRLAPSQRSMAARLRRGRSRREQRRLASPAVLPRRLAGTPQRPGGQGAIAASTADRASPQPR